MPEWVAVCRDSDVREGGALGVEVDGWPLAVYRLHGAFHALSGRCPHANGLLGKGWVDDGEAVCPLHRWRFRLVDGRCTTDRGYSVRTFACEARDGWVFVLAGSPLVR